MSTLSDKPASCTLTYQSLLLNDVDIEKVMNNFKGRSGLALL